MYCSTSTVVCYGGPNSQSRIPVKGFVGGSSARVATKVAMRVLCLGFRV